MSAEEEPWEDEDEEYAPYEPEYQQVPAARARAPAATGAAPLNPLVLLLGALVALPLAFVLFKPKAKKRKGGDRAPPRRDSRSSYHSHHQQPVHHPAPAPHREAAPPARPQPQPQPHPLATNRGAPAAAAAAKLHAAVKPSLSPAQVHAPHVHTPIKPVMSWQEYVDQYLMAAGLENAAIIGLDGGIWAQSPQFLMAPNEIKAVVAAFTDPGSLAANGLFINGNKYMVVQGDPGHVIRGKKGPAGCTIKRTLTAMVVGIYPEGMSPGQCNVAVEDLGDYLKGQNI